ncbi:putative integral membrane protein [Actinoplanes missouriensis 431]|uniref:Putative integral membrane protein n=2 Tax=Actinoplanes missouriensis TaxID=1866 RepID=I0HCX3_ACTM4|nr:putative integral membrane protein [Actinoplanes missouriensis 431]
MTLAGIAALAWGSSDFVAGVCARRMPIRTVLIGSKLAGMLFAVAFLAVRGQPLAADARLFLTAAAAGAIGLPAMGLLYRAMRDGSLAVVAPVAAVAALVPVAWGLMHGETFGPAAAAGGVAALAGITLASWPVTPSRPGDPLRGHHSPATVKTAVCGAGAALGFGLYFVLLHEAAPGDPSGATAYVRIAGGTLALLVLLARPIRSPAPSVPRGRSVWLLPAVVGVLDTVADGAFAFAAAAGTIGTAAILASMYPAVTVLLTTAVLRERLPRVHLVGVLSALVAVACLAV